MLPIKNVADWLTERGLSQSALIELSGLEKRVPWTTSKVIGSPEPPPPYRTEPAFPKLPKFDEPLDLTYAPGTTRLFVAERYGKIFSFVNKKDADKADLMATSTPYALLPDVLKQTVARMRDEDADFYDRLSKAGFLLTFGEDETGIGLMYPRRGSGYYIDVGASELIISKQVKLKTRVSVSHLTENAVVLSDGIALPADLVVYATGYGTMDNWAAELISQDVADKVGQCWGIGSGTERDPGPWTGELRNMWKPTAQEGLWFHGGNLAQSRHFSRYVAIQMKARYEGLHTQVYRGPV